MEALLVFLNICLSKQTIYKTKAPYVNCTPKVGHRSNLWGVFHGEVRRAVQAKSSQVVFIRSRNGVSYCDADQPFNDKSILYENYREFCKENGFQPCAVPQFFTRLHNEFPSIKETRTMMGKGADKKRVRCINLTTGVFCKEDLVEQVALEKNEIEKAFYG